LLTFSNNNTVFPLIFAERLFVERRVLMNEFISRTRTSSVCRTLQPLIELVDSVASTVSWVSQVFTQALWSLS
jgi:hypothetical protein